MARIEGFGVHAPDEGLKDPGGGRRIYRSNVTDGRFTSSRHDSPFHWMKDEG